MFKLKGRRCVILFLCVAILSQLFFTPTYAKTVSELRKEIERYGRELSRLEESKQSQSKFQEVLSKQIGALANQIHACDMQINELNFKISAKQRVVDELSLQIVQLEEQVFKMQKEIDALEVEKKETEDKLRARLGEDYEYGQSSALDVLFSSQDFGEFISNAVYLQKIAEYDKQLTDKMDEQISQIDQRKSKVEENMAQIVTDKQTVIDSISEINLKLNEVSGLKESQQSASSQLAAQLEKSTQETANIERARKRLQQARSSAQCELEDATDLVRSLQSRDWGSTPMPVDCSGYLYPVAGSTTFIRGYNPSTPHFGVDIGTHGRHSQILASRGGRVIASRFGIRGDGLGGYGNVVVIDHGDGYSTLYGHMLERRVHVGQFVSRGDCIGLVGNTGESYGIHCHFEIRHHGRPIRTPFG